MPHHGGPDVASPAMFAVQPRVAIMNNGAAKGGSPETFEALHQAAAGPAASFEVWQIDKSANAGVRNFADERIANLDDRTGHRIKVSAREDGAFTVTNLSDARSRIEDTDYSAETTALAKAQVLSQASTAMLSQANQSQQNVLSLLR